MRILKPKNLEEQRSPQMIIRGFTSRVSSVIPLQIKGQALSIIKPRGGGEGELPYENVVDIHKKSSTKPLQETNLGMAQALFDPLKTALKME